MTDQFLQWLVGLIQSGNTHPFYVSPEWRRLSARILQQDLHECQICKDRGRYSRAVLVHHVKHVKAFPSLALDAFYFSDDGTMTKNLISVCRMCHETVCHPERMGKCVQNGYRNAERWD